MTIAKTGIVTPADSGPIKHGGQPVSIRLTLGGAQQHMVGEIYSAPILRAVARYFTLWVKGRADADVFRIEACYFPVFTTAGELDAASEWAQIGADVELSQVSGLVAAQTVDDACYAFRIARITKQGNPDAGDFDVYVWSMAG